MLSSVIVDNQIPMCSESMPVEKLPQGNRKKQRNDASSSGFDYSKNISRFKVNEILNAGNCLMYPMYHLKNNCLRSGISQQYISVELERVHFSRKYHSFHFPTIYLNFRFLPNFLLQTRQLES